MKEDLTKSTIAELAFFCGNAANNIKIQEKYNLDRESLFKVLLHCACRFHKYYRIGCPEASVNNTTSHLALCVHLDNEFWIDWNVYAKKPVIVVKRDGVPKTILDIHTYKTVKGRLDTQIAQMILDKKPFGRRRIPTQWAKEILKNKTFV